MRKFWKIKEEDEHKKEQLGINQLKLDYKQQKLNKIKENLECEETLLEEKQRFGRVRTSVMKYMREKYGYSVANRVMWRVNKRVKNNSF